MSDNLVVFAYDFPHKKTSRFLTRLFFEGYKVTHIIAEPWRSIKSSEADFRVKPRHCGVLHPKTIANRIGAKYTIAKHNSKKTISILRDEKAKYHVISGARILKKEIITASNNSIINIHPAPLPQIRGLNSLLWTIYKDLLPGNSSHFINQKIDAGELILFEALELYSDDTLLDISLRIQQKQPDLLVKSLKLLEDDNYKPVSLSNLPNIQNQMSKKMIEKVLKKYPEWLKKYSKGDK